MPEIQFLGKTVDTTAMAAQLTTMQGQVTSTDTRVTTLESGFPQMLLGTSGTATLGANIGIAATFDLTVTFAATLSSTNYTACVSIEGAAGLLGVFVAQIKSKTTTGCVVSVKNTGLVSIGSGAVVRVVAII